MTHFLIVLAFNLFWLARYGADFYKEMYMGLEDGTAITIFLWLYSGSGIFILILDLYEK